MPFSHLMGINMKMEVRYIHGYGWRSSWFHNYKLIWTGSRQGNVYAAFIEGVTWGQKSGNAELKQGLEQ
jgi:hypothetical protein